MPTMTHTCEAGTIIDGTCVRRLGRGAEGQPLALGPQHRSLVRAEWPRPRPEPALHRGERGPASRSRLRG